MQYINDLSLHYNWILLSSYEHISLCLDSSMSCFGKSDVLLMCPEKNGLKMISKGALVNRQVVILFAVCSLLTSLSHRNLVLSLSFGCRAICRNAFSMLAKKDSNFLCFSRSLVDNAYLRGLPYQLFPFATALC